MKALVWHGKEDIRCDAVTDPQIEHEIGTEIKTETEAYQASARRLW